MDAALDGLASDLDAALAGAGPHVVGIGGPVAVGKSTVAEALAEAFRARGRRTRVVATDAFLLPNAELARRDALYRKGFPETYDWEAIERFVRGVKGGLESIRIPVYSHTVYDIVPDEFTAVGDVNLVLLEGVVALQERIRGLLDATLYIDADEADVKDWFAARFVRLTDEAKAGVDSFYRMFAQMTRDEVRAAAEGTWDAINGPNLHGHISKTRRGATFVMRKRADHSIEAVDRG